MESLPEVKRLINHSQICYAHVVIQSLFNIPELWNLIKTFDDEEPFRQIAKAYATSHKKNAHGFDIEPLYKNFPPFISINTREVNGDNVQQDPFEFFHKICEKYPNSISRLFGTLSTDGIEIKSSDKTVQEGIESIISQNTEEVFAFGDLLCIKIDRVGSRNIENLRNPGIRRNSTFLSKDSIKINNFIDFNYQSSNFKYKLSSIICHNNTETTQGHFYNILLRNGKTYFCSDTQVSDTIPKKISQNTVEKKVYLLFYSKTEENSDQSYFIVNNKNESSKENESSNKNKKPTQSAKQKIKQSITQPSPNEIITETCRNPGNKRISMELNKTNLNEFEKKVPTNIIKFDLRQEFENLYGFLDIEDGEAPNGDYDTNPPKYEKHARLLENMVSIICNTKFKKKVTNGELNASMTAETLGIQNTNPIHVQVVDCAVLMKYIFDTFIRKEGNRINIEQLKIKISDDLKDFIEQIGDNNDDSECDAIPEYPNDKYDWRSRSDIMGIEEILLELEKKKSELSQKQKNRNELRKQLYNKYRNEKHMYKSKREFVKKWIETRKATILPGELIYADKYAEKLLVDLMKTKGTKMIEPRLHVARKMTKEAKIALLCTVMDYPYLTDNERAVYLNKYVISEKPVSTRTVNYKLTNMKIKIKQPCFSVKERNSLGYLIARCLWSQVINQIINDQSVIPVFLDEAGVRKARCATSRGYVSITPLVEGNNKKYNTATVLSAIIPSYGTISKWFTSSITSAEYTKFIREVSYVMRTKICTKEYQIIAIQDNAKIHKSEEVRNMANKCSINLFFTVPYSPQTNLPAENYFGQLKYVLNFDHTIYAYKNIENEDIMDDDTELMNGVYSTMLLDEDQICIAWTRMCKLKYTSATSGKIYKAWLTVLNSCMEGKELRGEHYKASEDEICIKCKCYRKRNI